MDLINKTRKPISVPLPGGKKLHLGPGKTGQVTAKALEHPPLAALLKAGELAVTGSESHPPRGGGSPGAAKSQRQPGGRHGAPGAIRQSGDR